ncbi:hypothetical protein EDEG_00219 [Edhazardia aedis USNM 41457]|uniref:GPN-loop GTPase n=1 Tax=Edhazardia aedis (strain USNM 41457) TaxID=1003232 RepID=J9DL36_EDHAE|nr:hypothetical protein EDEG_00219 [Edhazardia aedis USNM 41457]|eukprot:EJW03310.1 hypothetical protein EDEG_00219 [Edhazardia aedis USNM 41457]
MNDRHIFLIVGMAGSGKTTFSQRLYSWLTTDSKLLTNCIDDETGLNKYIFSVNIDPAVLNAKMPLNEDIRDSVDYEDVMTNYNLGPNGAIVTCLNLYLLKVDSFIKKIEDKSHNIPHYVIIDTPGQIEAFTWSSPGLVLVESLKALEKYKLSILYVIDSVISTKPTNFIANMLYAASLSSRFQCEISLIFNKSDLLCQESRDTLNKWFEDYNYFRSSLDQESMSTPMISSLALYFEEFYSLLKKCFVSSFVGIGKKELYDLLQIQIEKFGNTSKDSNNVAVGENATIIIDNKCYNLHTKLEPGISTHNNDKSDSSVASSNQEKHTNNAHKNKDEKDLATELNNLEF